MSTSYGSGDGSRSNSAKDGAHFLVYYKSGSGSVDRQVSAVGRAKYFIRVLHPMLPGGVARFVIADFFHLFQTAADSDLGKSVSRLTGRKQVYTSTDYPVLLDIMDCQGLLLTARSIMSVPAELKAGETIHQCSA